MVICTLLLGGQETHLDTYKIAELVKYMEIMGIIMRVQ